MEREEASPGPGAHWLSWAGSVSCSHPRGQTWARAQHQCSLGTPAMSQTQPSPEEVSTLWEQVCTGQFNFLFSIKATYFLKSPGTRSSLCHTAAVLLLSWPLPKAHLTPGNLLQQLCSRSRQSITESETATRGQRLLSFLIRYLASSTSCDPRGPDMEVRKAGVFMNI